jgi:uncharacterized protein
MTISRFHSASVLSAIILAQISVTPVMADTLAPPVPLPIGQSIEAPVRSFAALRFDGIVRQTHDLSCGAAALATLLRGYFGHEVTEKSVIDTILANTSETDKNKIGEAGFSMLELVGGFRARNAEELRNLRAPAIVLVTNRGYSHFVVVRRVVGNDVYIADPAFGNRVDPLARFARSWNNVFLVAVDPRQAQLPEARRLAMTNFRNASPQGRDARGLQASLNRPTSVPLQHVTGEY